MVTETRARRLMSTAHRPRMSAAEVRAAMLETAVKAVNTAGLTVSLDHISMDAVVLEAGVARSAAYRVWPQRAQFIRDLLLAVARSPSVAHSAFDPETLRAGLTALEPWRGRLTSVEARRGALVEACRIGVLQNFESLAADRGWQTEIALRATILSFPADEREELQNALDEAVATYVQAMANFYEMVSNVMGYEMAPGRDYYFLAQSGSSIVEGILLRGAVLPEPRRPEIAALAERFDADPFGTGTAQWNAAGIAFTGNLLALTRPSDDFDPTAFDRWYDRAAEYIRQQEADHRG